MSLPQTCRSIPRRIRQVLLILLLLIAATLKIDANLSAQTRLGSASSVRTILPSEWDVPYPAGIAYSSQAVELHLLGKNSSPSPAANGAEIVTITPYEEWIGAVHLDFAPEDSINIAYVDEGSRLFLLSRQANKLAQVKTGTSGLLEPSTLLQFDIASLNLGNPQGMSVDSTSQQLWILDSDNARAVAVALKADSGIDIAQSQAIDLSALNLGELRGIAVHPLNYHLFVGNPAQKKLYEVDRSAQLIATYDLTALELVDQQGMVFAPSADLTDPPDRIHLFIADSNLLGDPPATATPISTAPTSTPIATAPTATPIATAPTATATRSAATSTAIPTAPTPTATRSTATSTAIPTAPTPTATRSTATSTAIPTVPTATATRSAATSTAIPTAPTATATRSVATSTATSTAIPATLTITTLPTTVTLTVTSTTSTPTLQPTATKANPEPTEVLSEDRKMYFPLVTHDNRAENLDLAHPPAQATGPVFGQIIEVRLE